MAGISHDRFHELSRCLIGLRITKPWHGYGSAIFIELGKLTLEKWKNNEAEFGEACVGIEWSWRVERKRSIAFGSWSGERKMNSGIESLIGRRVEEVVLVGRLPEIMVQMSGGLWLHSFMTAEGKPEWRVKLIDGSWISYEGGRIVHEPEKGPTSRHSATRT
jgi:hypothetical protein